MTPKLFWTAIGKFAAGTLVLGVLLFLPAGSFAYRQGWLFLAVLLIPMFFAGLFLMKKNPELLKKRLNAKEKMKDQGLVIRLSGLMFSCGFVIAGLNFRWGFLTQPRWLSWAAAAGFLLCYALYGEVLRENTYLSRTIEVQKDQKVVDTGLYGIVRHPMYSVTVLLFLTMPLILGSPVSFLIFLAYPLIIAKRIRGEERFLEENLPGYRDYEKKVRWRLLPYIW